MLSQPQIRRLLDVALAGCHIGNILAARHIYAGLLALRPDFAPAKIGTAFSHIVVNEFEQAEKILCDDVLARNPNDNEAYAMLGLCLVLAQRKDYARAILTPLAEKNEPASALAKELLTSL